MQTTLDENSDLSKEIYDNALSLFIQHCDFSLPYRSIGVAVSKLSSIKDSYQTSFFQESSYSIKQQRQENAMLEIRRRFGKDSVNLMRAYEDSVLSKQVLKNADIQFQSEDNQS